MASRASSRAGGYVGNARHDAEIAAAAAGLTLDEWLAEAARAAAAQPTQQTDSVSRIMSSLDRLGARIRTLTPAEPEPPVDDRADLGATTADDLQRAIDQIARKRDALERTASQRGGNRREDDRDMAAIGARVRALSQSDRPSARRSPEPMGDDLRDGIATIKAMISELLSTSPGQSLASTYESLVERIDDLRSAVDNPRAISDLVQRLADIRRQIASIPGEAQFDDLMTRLDKLAERIDFAQGDPNALSDFGRSLGDLASAVGRLDQRGLIAGIERRLDDVAGQINTLETRLAGPIGHMERWNEASGHQTALMSQIAQRSEQLPRLAHELERQAASVERMVRSADALPHLTESIDAIRSTLDGDMERSRTELKTLLERLDDLSNRLDDPAKSLPVTGNDSVERRLGEIVARLDRLSGSLDHASIDAIDEHFARLNDSIARQLRDLGHGETGSTVEQLLDALGRIEAKLGDGAPPQRLADIEDRIGALTRSLGGIDFATTKDIAALDRLVTSLREDVAALASPDQSGIEAEIRRLGDQIAKNGAPAIDAEAFTKLEERLTRLVDRLENRPAEVTALADAFEKLERTISDTLSADAIAERITSASERGRSGDGDRRLVDLGTVEAEVGRLAEELRADAGHDRELLVAIGDAVQKLAERQLGTGGASAPPSVPSSQTGSTWNDIEKALSNNFARSNDAPTSVKPPEEAQRFAAPEAKAAPEPVVPAPSDDDMPRIFGRKVKTRARAETADGASPDRIEPAFDADKPLEPGSGKPRLTREETPAADAPAGAAPKAEGIPSKADFIAAARRAAMAAGADDVRSASPVEMKAKPPRAGRQPVMSVLLGHKRQFLMGVAAALVVAGLVRIGIILFLSPASPPVAAISNDASTPAAITAPAATVAPSAPTAPAPDAQTSPSSSAPQASPAGNAGGPLSSVPADEALSGSTATASAGFSDKPTDLTADHFAQPDAPANAETDPITTSATNPVGNGGLALPPSAIGSLALRQAAASGDPLAQYEVAARFADGRGVAADLAQAVEWYTHAADSGLAPAQYRLGSLYEKGQGVARDPKAAAALYTKAAAQGNAKAMHNLAVLNAEGGLGEPNYQMAAKLFQQAAEFGVRDSQFNLGILFARGLGVPRDLPSSYKWFAIAANGGDADAAKKRDDIAQVLSKDDLARARLAVETWQAKPLDPSANNVIISNPAWTATPDHTASIDETKTVARVQSLLGRLGFDAGPADGRMGKKTHDAIAAFQKSRGQTVTGEIDAALLSVIGSEAI